MPLPSSVRHFSNRCAIEPGFFLFLGVAAYLLPLPLLGSLLLAAALHELGHLTALRAVRGSGAAVRLGVFGAEIVLPPLPAGRAALVALAGPALNLLAAALPLPAVFRAVSLLLGVFNLLPLRPLDGGQLLLLLTERFFPAPARAADAAERAFLGAALAAALWAGFRFSLGLAPLLAALLVTARLLAEKQVANRPATR